MKIPRFQNSKIPRSNAVWLCEPVGFGHSRFQIPNPMQCGGVNLQGSEFQIRNAEQKGDWNLKVEILVWLYKKSIRVTRCFLIYSIAGR
jgi:hypothetical protein